MKHFNCIKCKDTGLRIEVNEYVPCDCDASGKTIGQAFLVDRSPAFAPSERPASFERAMEFLGDPEASELRAYIERLEAGFYAGGKS